MGGSSSKQILETKLHAQASPIAAIDTRFCFPELVTLHLHEKGFSWSGDDFAIRDVRTNTPVFQIHGTAVSLHQRKTLKDMSGALIACMRNKSMTFKPVYNIYADENANKQLLQLRVLERTLNVVVATEFTDPGTGTFWRVLLEGNWRARAATISLIPTSGSNIKRIPVARIFRPTTGSSTLLGKHDYYVDIAPNVDAILVVLLCVAMDECKKD